MLSLIVLASVATKSVFALLGPLGRALANPSRGSWLVGLGALLGLLLGLGLVLERPRGQASQVSVLEHTIVLGPDAESNALELLRRHTNDWFRLRVDAETALQVSFGELGVAIDTLRASQLVRDARDPTSPLSKTRQRRSHSGPLKLPVALVLDHALAETKLLRLKNQLDRTAVPARLDLALRTVRAEQSGRELDVDASLAVLERALREGRKEASLVFELREPLRRAADLAGVRYDHVLGHFETPYDRSERARARTENLRLAASKLDGVVLLPGDEFDFNAVVGPRDEANGYQVAPVIAQGELVDGIGGGTCQISGTLHGAAFFAGLDLVERHPHTRPSSYIKLGLDAAVVYPTINFRFRNPFEHPVVLHQTVSDGVVRAEILGPKTKRITTLIRRLLSAIPFEQAERLDPKLPRGARVLAQRGIPGFRVARYRITRLGRHAERERFGDTYPPTTQIVRVGTGRTPTTYNVPSDDPHPEYVADELLIMTQVRDAGEVELRTQRTPGKFGHPGWSEKAGMPVWTGRGTAGKRAQLPRIGHFSVLRESPR